MKYHALLYRRPFVLENSSIQLNSVPFSSVQSSTKISTSLLIQHIVKLFLPSPTLHKPGRSPRFSVFSPSGGPRPAMANVNVNASKTESFIKLSSHPKWYISLEVIFNPCSIKCTCVYTFLGVYHFCHESGK